MARSLYLKRVVLENIRSFEFLDVAFENVGESIVIVGDNGDGKSTLLRSIAMGICDQSSAAALFRELHGTFVRAGAPHGYGLIDIELGGQGARSFHIETRITALKTFERVEQKLYVFDGKRKRLHQDSFPWGQVFASAYGAGIRVQGSLDVEDYLTVDAVYPLFKYDVLLQNPELVIRRLLDSARKKHGKRGADKLEAELKAVLARVLLLDDVGHISFEPTGIYVKRGRDWIALSAQPDGFRGTVTWVLDLLAWWFVHQPVRRHNGFLDVAGIVLIDEIEQHLHPIWQRKIMPILKAAFPRVQFIATTHSPLVASGCEGIPVHSLLAGKHEIIEPFGWLAEDVYAVMGVPTSRAASFQEEILTEFSKLDLKRLRGQATAGEMRTLRRLRLQLDSLPGTDPLRVATELQNIRQSIQRDLKPTRRRS